MKDGRIKIIKRKSVIKNGRKELEEEDYYTCWCEVKDLSAKETYEALQQGMENTIVFDVRTCRKINEVCLDTREFYVRYMGRIYKIYNAQPFYSDEQKTRIKCRGVV